MARDITINIMDELLFIYFRNLTACMFGILLYCLICFDRIFFIVIPTILSFTLFTLIQGPTPICLEYNPGEPHQRYGKGHESYGDYKGSYDNRDYRGKNEYDDYIGRNGYDIKWGHGGKSYYPGRKIQSAVCTSYPKEHGYRTGGDQWGLQY